MRPGDLLSHYRIVDTLGEGGMGVVYRAVDVRLNRTVALKVIRHGAAGDDARQRFVREARAASAFNHPNIVTIHEVDTDAGTDFIVMELVPGRPLTERVAGAAVPIDQAIAIAEQIATAMAAAHDAGIVHRDIKPANVMVTDTGHVKVLDFGVAKQLAVSSPDAVTQTAADATRQGAVLGSVAYMSPEQTQGQPIDGRSDVFSLGILMYEMLCGRRPFVGATGVETVAKILVSEPASLAQLRPDVPQALAALVTACLTKDRDGRPAAAEVSRQLAAVRQSRLATPVRAREAWSRRVVLVPIALIVLGALGFVAWNWYAGRDVRDARRRLPQLLALATEADGYHAFYKEARAVVALLPDDPKLQAAWNVSTMPLPIAVEPADAEIRVKGYSASEDDWILAGRTPMSEVRVPIGTPRIKISKAGYATFDGTITAVPMQITLDPVSSVPEGMIHLPKATIAVEGVTADIPDFWMDRFEVSNRQFKAFVDAGGYTAREYWKEPFVENGRTLSWDDAMRRFTDKTGRPGPSTWELGTYPQGQADFPVAGVSWYEAAAFAAFAGKALPTAFQWRRGGDFAGPSAVFGHILLFSNFGAKGPSAIGSQRGIGPWGTYDMAGNVKEWCWNESGTGRMILGGGWSEPTYMYGDRDAQPPFKRLDTYGFRLVKNVSTQPAASTAYIPPYLRDYAVEKPIDDTAFAIVKSVFKYDPRPLNAKLERTEDEEDWRRETVTLDAAYGTERVIAYFYLPKNASPPYQTVIYFPGGDALAIRSSRQLRLIGVDFLMRSGRAVVFPVYQGTYERGQSAATGPNARRDNTVARVKDFRRVVEYIETRSDLDRDRLGYFGRSLGANAGTIITAIEPRLKASVLYGGGLSRFDNPPEVDPLNFAPRIHVPTLMVNGAGDFQYPLESTQKPLFRLLGVPPDKKRHALFEGGHMPIDFNGVLREILDWFDRFLGPVGAKKIAT